MSNAIVSFRTNAESPAVTTMSQTRNETWLFARDAMREETRSKKPHTSRPETRTIMPIRSKMTSRFTAARASLGVSTPKTSISAPPNIATAGLSSGNRPMFRSEIRTYVRRKIPVAATSANDNATGTADGPRRYGTLLEESGSTVFPLRLNTVTQFAAFSGPPNRLRGGPGRLICDRRETRMDLRNRRGFGALVVLLAVLLGAVALPMLTLAASNQITGIVSDCVSSSVIPGAQVTLADANGYYPAQKATTGGDGVYAFSPGSGSYTLMANRSGYFAKGAPSPIRFDGQSTVRQDICLDPTPPLNKVAQLTVVNDVTSAVISGAVVDAYYAAASQVVASGTSSVTGQVNLTLFTATFELRTNGTGFITNVVALEPATTTTLTIRLQLGNIVQGHASNTGGQFLSAGLVGFLYDPNTATPKSSPFKVIRAAVTGSFYQFHVPAGVTYDMVIDANGYKAYTTTVTTIAGTLTRDATLAVSDPEKFSTTIVYGSNDWSNLTIYR